MTPTEKLDALCDKINADPLPISAQACPVCHGGKTQMITETISELPDMTTHDFFGNKLPSKEL